MKTPIAAACAVALAAHLLAPGATAQIFNRKPAPSPAAPASAPADPNVARAQAPAPGRPLQKDGVILPGPTDPGAVKPVVPLPTEPLEPYMLTKEHGPFMVLAYTYRGPDAPRQALALVLELRNKYRLPAYILLPRKFPGKTPIRGVPPQAPTFVTRDDVGFPEIVRAMDEAAVMVGNEKTVKDSTDLLHKVKKLHPEAVDGVKSSIWDFRKGEGLSRALRTTNPFIPAEQLFPQAQDALIGKINGEGEHNIRHCPGKYTLQVATFTGRQTMDPEHDQRFKGALAALKSPLATAADDAERLAEALAKDQEVQKTGCLPYVYHDRYSSRVTMGSFDTPNDPNAQKLHARLVELAFDLNHRKVTDVMIVPASNLLDLTPIKKQLQGPTAMRAN